jgi:hypothetical protein
MPKRQGEMDGWGQRKKENDTGPIANLPREDVTMTNVSLDLRGSPATWGYIAVRLLAVFRAFDMGGKRGCCIILSLLPTRQQEDQRTATKIDGIII